MNKVLKKRMTIMVIGLVAVFGGIVAFNLIKSFMIKRFFASFQAPAVTVSSVTAKKMDWEPSIHAVGNFTAINGVEVSSQAAGNVVAIHFKSGELIKKHKPLIDIDDSVDVATLKFNQSDLALQKLNFQRQTDLFKRGATPSSSVDEAQAKLLQAQANVEKTEALIQQKHITAPFTGKLGIRQINLGQYISPGQTNIVTLQSLDPLFLEFYLPEQLLKRIHIHQDIIFSVEQYPNLFFSGQITAINSKVDVNTHNILVQATIPNCPSQALKDPKHASGVKTQLIPFLEQPLVLCNSEVNEKNQVDDFSFIPGMFAEIQVDQPTISNVIALPTTAISYSLYGDSVFVIERDPESKKDSSDNPIYRVKRTFVQTGEQQGNYTLIKNGLKEGQIVVSSGELKLQDGTPVIINNEIQLNERPNIETIGE